MKDQTTDNRAFWFPHHFLGESPSLGRRGVFFQQFHGDCGGAALKMILDHFDIAMDYESLWRQLQDGPGGTTMLDIKTLAESLGLCCDGWRFSVGDLLRIPLPAILLAQRKHFVVLAAINASRGALILDPVRGRVRVSLGRLMSFWQGETLLFHKPPKGFFKEGSRRCLTRRSAKSKTAPGRRL